MSRSQPTKNISQNVTEVLFPMHLILSNQTNAAMADTFMTSEAFDLNSLVVIVAFLNDLPPLHYLIILWNKLYEI